MIQILFDLDGGIGYDISMTYITEPHADKRAVIEYGDNLQYYGLHPLCESCEKDCYQYNAPNLIFSCCDFRRRFM